MSKISILTMIVPHVLLAGIAVGTKAEAQVQHQIQQRTSVSQPVQSAQPVATDSQPANQQPQGVARQLAWFDEYDTDNDGQVSMFEYINARGGVLTAEIAAEFRFLDGDNDGFATMKETLTAVREYAEQQRVREATAPTRRAPQPFVELRGHTDEIESVLFSPDGRVIATASADNTVVIWEVASGRQLQRLVGHTSGITSIAFSPNGKTIVTGSQDGTARIWNLAPAAQPITTVFVAAQWGTVDDVRRFIEEGENVNQRDRANNTLLHIAVRNPNIAVLRYLITQGADVNAKNNIGNAPLHEVARSGSVANLRHLVTVSDGQINERNNANQTPLDIANSDTKRTILREAGGVDGTPLTGRPPVTSSPPAQVNEAVFCFLQAIVEIDDRPQALIDHRIIGVVHRLFEGDSFMLQGHRCIINKIDMGNEQILVEIVGKLFSIKVGQHFDQFESVLSE